MYKLSYDEIVKKIHVGYVAKKNGQKVIIKSLPVREAGVINCEFEHDGNKDISLSFYYKNEMFDDDSELFEKIVPNNKIDNGILNHNPVKTKKNEDINNADNNVLSLLKQILNNDYPIKDSKCIPNNEKNIDKVNVINLDKLICQNNPRNDGFWSYDNLDSNDNYITSYYHSYSLENYSFIKYLFKKHIEKLNYSYKKIDIAIIGGGNFFELDAINQVAGIYKRTPVNVTVIDINFWQRNMYSLYNSRRISNINLIKNDFFNELSKTNNYDIICFSRCINFTDFLNWSKINNSDLYFDKLIKIIKDNIDYSTIGFIQVSKNYLNEKSIDFEYMFERKLIDNGIRFNNIKSFDYINGEHLTPMSEMIIIKKLK